ncbi:putative toxin-antitoxin system toxin component, PIN family [Candidatus Woesearchaeota archaeon CG10_big_fil_rev_8_21_14_0_10_37_12]|nr:MAG: putative toxin-antitoxin system toxin component, PIN family [Candidatus Woesearchaeota archaeon CG10_big_fil_rev_8_21_14_0_10_37_12]
MIRVVLDTNIFISGIFWPGNYCAQIIDAWKEGKFETVTSEEIVKELVETLFEFKIKLTEEKISAWEKEILERSLIVAPINKLDLVKDDPDDNKFFEAAIAANAQYIVSQDKHHLRIGEFKGIKVLTPEEFLTIFEK